jgi:hypothetical protein
MSEAEGKEACARMGWDDDDDDGVSDCVIVYASKVLGTTIIY